MKNSVLFNKKAEHRCATTTGFGIAIVMIIFSSGGKRILGLILKEIMMGSSQKERNACF